MLRHSGPALPGGERSDVKAASRRPWARHNVTSRGLADGLLAQVDLRPLGPGLYHYRMHSLRAVEDDAK